MNLLDHVYEILTTAFTRTLKRKPTKSERQALISFLESKSFKEHWAIFIAAEATDKDVLVEIAPEGVTMRFVDKADSDVLSFSA